METIQRSREFRIQRKGFSKGVDDALDSVAAAGAITNGSPMQGENNVPKLNENLPETLPLSSNAEINHRIDPVVDRNAHPLVGPLERVGVEGLIISNAFLALPAIDLCHKCTHGAVIERRPDIIHTLPPIIDRVPSGLHNLIS